MKRLTYSQTRSFDVWNRCAPYWCTSMPVVGSSSLNALPPMWSRRSMTCTRMPSSVAARSAIVRPKNPEPTTTRSVIARHPRR